MAPQLGLELGHHHEMANTGLDRCLTARAQIALAGGVRLDDGDVVYPERAAHATNPTAANRVITTIAMSATRRSCWRNGLKPIRRW